MVLVGRAVDRMEEEREGSPSLPLKTVNPRTSDDEEGRSRSTVGPGQGVNSGLQFHALPRATYQHGHDAYRNQRLVIKSVVYSLSL